jgi:Fe-S-cluster containining protein
MPYEEPRPKSPNYPADRSDLDRVFRHLSRLDIDLDDLEMEVESTFPDESDPVGVRSTTVSRTLALADYPDLDSAMKKVVDVVRSILAKPYREYDARRCDRCVKSDCCSFERILVTEEEVARIVDFLGEPRSAIDRYAAFEPDLGGYFTHRLKHRNGHCVFLKSNGVQMRCSVYEARPEVCREYDAGTCTEWTKMLPVTRKLEV